MTKTSIVAALALIALVRGQICPAGGGSSGVVSGTFFPSFRYTQHWNRGNSPSSKWAQRPMLQLHLPSTLQHHATNCSRYLKPLFRHHRVGSPAIIRYVVLRPTSSNQQSKCSHLPSKNPLEVDSMVQDLGVILGGNSI